MGKMRDHVPGRSAEGGDIVFRIQDKTLHTIDPRMFGQFMERPSWGEIGPEGALTPGTNHLQPKVRELIEEMQPPVMRFPGGTDVGFLDWRDMVSNVPGRGAERPVSVGHKGHKVTNNYGFDEFLALCEDLNSDPILVVNLRNALLEKKPIAEAARDAAELVAYCNAPVGSTLPEGMPDWAAVRKKNGREKPYGVKLWQIGNETWFPFKQIENMTEDEKDKHGAKCIVALCRAMLEVDPTIEFIVDGHGETFKASLLAREELGDKICNFVFHHYAPWQIKEVLKNGETVPLDSLGPADVWSAWVSTPGIDKDGLAVFGNPLLAEARNRGLRVAITEWNWNGGWAWGLRPGPFKSALAKGIGAAGYLHAMMRAGDVVDIGCQSMLVGIGWDIHAIHADREDKEPAYYMPSGQATMLYSHYHGPNRLDVVAENVPAYEQPFKMAGIQPRGKVACLDALATAGDEAIFFHVINRSFDHPYTIEIDVTELGPLGTTAIRHTLTGRLNDKPEKGEPAQVAEIVHAEIAYDGKTLAVTLPARTVSVIELPRVCIDGRDGRNGRNGRNGRDGQNPYPIPQTPNPRP
jgi:alpha-N-arabinofuranosidase